jgi:hypothetical protein
MRRSTRASVALIERSARSIPVITRLVRAQPLGLRSDGACARQSRNAGRTSAVLIRGIVSVVKGRVVVLKHLLNLSVGQV